MGRTWVFEETEKKMIPMRNEWGLIGNPAEPFHFDDMGWQETTILKLTEYPENPLGPIQEVWYELHRGRFDHLTATGRKVAEHEMMWQAIQKCRKIAEGK